MPDLTMPTLKEYLSANCNEKERQAYEMHGRGNSHRAIAEKLGMTMWQVWKAVKMTGSISADDARLIIDLYKADMTISCIGMKLGISSNAVIDKLKQAGLYQKRRTIKNTKKQQAAEMLAQGKSVAEISVLLDMDPGYVRVVKRSATKLYACS